MGAISHFSPLIILGIALLFHLISILDGSAIILMQHTIEYLPESLRQATSVRYLFLRKTYCLTLFLLVEMILIGVDISLNSVIENIITFAFEFGVAFVLFAVNAVFEDSWKCSLLSPDEATLYDHHCALYFGYRNQSITTSPKVSLDMASVIGHGPSNVDNPIHISTQSIHDFKQREIGI